MIEKIFKIFKKAVQGDTFVPIDIFLNKLSAENINSKKEDYIASYGESYLVYRCVQKIAGEVATIPLKLYQVGGGRETLDAREIKNNPVKDLLDNPNPYQTRYDFFYDIQTFLELDGNAYILKIRDNTRKIIALWHLRPDYVRTNVDGGVIKGYTYTLDGKMFTYPVEDIIHFREANPANWYYGQPTIKSAIDLVRMSVYAIRWNKEFFNNFGRPDSLLVLKGASLTQEATNELKRKWNNKFGGYSNAHQIAVMTGDGADLVKLGSDIKDMDFERLTNSVREDVLIAFGVPKGVIMTPDSMSRANAETARWVFLSDTIEPKLARIVEKINKDLVREFGDNLIYDYDDPTPENREAVINEYERALSNGWMCINEVRDREGLKPVNGGWEILVPFSMQPLSGEGKEGKEEEGGEEKPKKAKKEYRAMRVNKTSYLEMKEKKAQERVLRKFGELNKRYFVKEDLKGIVKKMIEARIKRAYSDEEKDEMWKAHDDMLGKNTKLFLSLIKALLKRQEARILKRLNENKSMEKSTNIVFDIDWEIEKLIFREASEPIVAKIVEERGKKVASVLGSKFVMTDEVKKFVVGKAKKFADEVNETTKGILKNKLKGSEDLEKDVKNAFSGMISARTNGIAITETTSASGEADIVAYKQSGVVKKKQWLSCRDTRVRDSHKDLDGEVRGLDEKFSNGLLYPGDMKGKASEVCNCRCTTIPYLG